LGQRSRHDDGERRQAFLASGSQDDARYVSAPLATRTCRLLGRLLQMTDAFALDVVDAVAQFVLDETIR
jgi:hypothetical protein